MMEIIIAVGLGTWFAVSIAVACWELFRSFKKENKEDDNV